MSKDSNHTILPGTIAFYSGVVAGMTWGEALAVLKILGNYHVDTVWVQKRSHRWLSIQARKLKVKTACPVGKVNIEIEFTGGPPSSKTTGGSSYKGYIASLVVDRVLRTCERIGKTQTQRRIFQIIAKIRKTERETSECKRQQSVLCG